MNLAQAIDAVAVQEGRLKAPSQSRKPPLLAGTRAEQVLALAALHHGQVHTRACVSELRISYGLASVTLHGLVRSGRLVRVRRGLYQLPGDRA